MDTAKLGLEQILYVREDGGHLIIEPVEAEAVSLEELVAKISEDNRHGEINFSRSVGREAHL